MASPARDEVCSDNSTASSCSAGAPVTLWQHPDTLYDAEYEPISLDPSAYRVHGNKLRAVQSEGANGDVELRFEAFVLRVSSPQAGVLRLQILRDETLCVSTTERLGLTHFEKGNAATHVEETGGSVVVRTSDFIVRCQVDSGELLVSDLAGTTLWQTTGGGIRFCAEKAPATHLDEPYLCESVVQDGERFFGFGGRIAPPDRTGSTVDVFSVKAGLRSGDYGGFPLPFFISTRGYGFFVNNPWPHVYFDMGKHRPDRWLLHAPGGDCDIILLAGPTFADIVCRYTSITGRIPAVPRWLIGFWCSSLEFRSAAQALADARRMRAEQYPCDAFVFDGPWRGGRDFAAIYAATQQYPSGDLKWHADFGDGPTMIGDLQQLHIKTVLHLNSRNYAPHTVAHGLAAGLLRRHGQEVVVRVLHREAEQYYQTMLAPRIDEGVALWWTDHSDRVSGEIAPGLPSRNLFGALWNRLLTDIMQRHGVKGHMSLSRGGGIGSQRYAIPWPGDTRCGVDALADDIWFMLGAGLGGFALSSVDLGGFAPRKNPKTDYATQEQVHADMFDDQNICRRVCHCLFYTPVPRIHNNWATVPKLPWNCSPAVQQLYRHSLQERYRLTPYLYSCVLNASIVGEPLLRPLAYYHPDDPQAVAASTQFYLGQWLLVAPVTEPGRETWQVYLPAGRWIHLWSDQAFEGPAYISVPAPLHAVSGLPVFVKAGAIVPRQPLTSHLEDAVPAELELDIYPSRHRSEITLHEAETIVTRFSLSPADGGYELRLENNLEQPRRYTIHLPPSPKVQVTVDGSRRSAVPITGTWGQNRLVVEHTVPPRQCGHIEVRNF